MKESLEPKKQKTNNTEKLQEQTKEKAADKKAVPDSPKTGDDFIPLMIAISGAGIALAVLIVQEKSRKRKGYK